MSDFWDHFQVVSSYFNMKDHLLNYLFIYLNLFMYLLDENECISSPCQQNGQCKVSGDSYECVCSENLEGKNCDSKCSCNVIQSDQRLC